MSETHLRPTQGANFILHRETRHCQSPNISEPVHYSIELIRVEGTVLRTNSKRQRHRSILDPYMYSASRGVSAVDASVQVS